MLAITLSWPSLIKHTSSDLEDSLAEVEKICCGLVSSEHSEVLAKPNRFFQTQLSYPLSQNLYPLSYPLRIHIMLLGMPLREPNT